MFRCSLHGPNSPRVTDYHRANHRRMRRSPSRGRRNGTMPAPSDGDRWPTRAQAAGRPRYNAADRTVSRETPPPMTRSSGSRTPMCSAARPISTEWRSPWNPARTQASGARKSTARSGTRSLLWAPVRPGKSVASSVAIVRTCGSSRGTTPTWYSNESLALLAAVMSADPSTPATRHRRSERFRATIARSKLVSPPEKASTGRPRPSTATSIAASTSRTNASIRRGGSMLSRDDGRLAREELRNRFRELGLGHADLLLGVALPDRDALPFEGLVVHRHRERCPDLVHARVSSPDRAGVIIERREASSQVREEHLGPLREAVLVHEREYGDGHGREPRGEPQDQPVPLGEGEIEEGPHVPVDAERQLEDVRHELRCAERHGLLGVRACLVAFQVVVRAVMDAADLAEAAEALLPDLDVEMDLVVERSFLLIEFREPERVPRDSEGREVESLDGEQM